jgi:hypothetical protein
MLSVVWFPGSYLFSKEAALALINCTTIRIRSTSEQIVRNDKPDFSNKNHAAVTIMILLIEALGFFQRIMLETGNE